MFTLNTRELHTARSYADAEVLMAAAEKAGKRRRDDTPGEYRIPAKWNSPQLGVRRRGDDAITFRYHRTDVVTWHPDGAFTIAPGMFSRSTKAFAEAFLPNSINIYNEARVLVSAGTAYALSEGATHFAPYKDAEYGTRHKLAEGQRLQHHFYQERIDRKAARTVLSQYRYAEYAAWHKVMSKVFETPRQYGSLPNETVLADLALGLVDCSEDEPVGWTRLLYRHCGAPSTIREVIYRRHRADGVYYYDTRNTLDLGPGTYWDHHTRLKAWSIG
jgi:hypothetical protein